MGMSHKLCTYILAQDKKAKKEGKGKDKKKSKEKEHSDEEKDKKKKKKDKKDKESDEEKEKKKKKKDKDKKEKEKDKESSKEKKKKKMDKGVQDEKKSEDLAHQMDDLSLDEEGTDDISAMLMAVESTKRYLSSNADATPSELLELVVNQQMASALKSFDKIHIFIRAAITSDFWEKELVQKYAPTVSLITNQNPIMERHLIAALEHMAVGSPKHFPVLLKLMYDEDALDEGVILEWASEGRSEYTLVSEELRSELRGEAEPVVIWLQDDDSDEEDDE